MPHVYTLGQRDPSKSQEDHRTWPSQSGHWAGSGCKEGAPAGSQGRSRGSTRGLPTALPCRSASTTSWRYAAAYPLTPGCTASSAALRCPRSSPPRATTCVWSSSRTTRSPNVASEPTSSQVCGFGGKVTGRHGCVGSQPLGHLPTPLCPPPLPSQYFALEGACLDLRFFILVAILLLQGCHNTLPHSVWLETTEMYSLAVVEAGNLHQGVGRALKALGDSFLASN